MKKEDFEQRLKEKFGHRFLSLNLLDNFSVDDKVSLLCSEHGEFSITPYHLFKSEFGCRKCRVFIKHNSPEEVLEKFLIKAEEVHGNNYDYSRVNFTSKLKDMVEIGCKECGAFYSQRAQSHLDGTGCGYCSGRKETFETFKKKAIEKWGNLYEYPDQEYKGTLGDIKVICKEHGEFNSKVTNFLNNLTGCPKCSLRNKQLKKAGELAKKFFSFQEYFINKASIVHGNKYDYSKVNYGKNNKEPICIICPTHGEFLQRPNDHIRFLKKTQEGYLQEVKEILTTSGDLENYDLSQINYINAQTKIILRCIKHDFTWGILPGKLRWGRRCPKCKPEKLHDKFASTTEKFIKRSEEIYGVGTYSYDKVNYVRNTINVEVFCKKHGYINVLPSHWLGRKTGCPKCSRENQINPNKKSLPQLINASQLIHLSGIYDYSKLDGLKGIKEKQEIICNNHGPFLVTMDNHIHGKSGCPKCSGQISLAEREVSSFINEIGLATENNKPILDKKHIDIFIPSLNIGVEYCGLYFHGELIKDNKKYHLEKFLLAKKMGIQLIQIFEDEWIWNKNKVKNTLLSKLGKVSNRTFARNLVVKEIGMKEANAFFEDTHLQGSTGSITKGFSLIDSDGKIIGSMAFTPANVSVGEIELSRFSSKGVIVGGFSKLLSKAKKDLIELGYKSIISYSDNRWSNGNVYEKNGFKNLGITVPRYWWCKAQYRFHRRGFQRKYLQEKLKVFKEELSEAENCRANGYYKIWDAGITRWKLEL